MEKAVVEFTGEASLLHCAFNMLSEAGSGLTTVSIVLLFDLSTFSKLCKVQSRSSPLTNLKIITPKRRRKSNKVKQDEGGGVVSYSFSIFHVKKCGAEFNH